ncbi:Mu-like prophage protein gp36 [Loktanella sp. DSM 29012]|uniref:gp436 family protein n=1 Tax=Loktanella sp. DSM 29012 TaxID=1881056 RepID=UPI0008CAE60D|nr:DUF1320 domain-containing protein [Loktanella sp. DSM 29012]SEQ59752.1 Mu-like prophage protein gp36 [Loktanella sp. DSM 29012]
MAPTNFEDTMYASQDDIITLYTADALVVADRDGDGVPDDAAITRALRSASAEINGYVGVRYDLPLADPHDILTQYCVDIALYRLAGSSSTMTEELRQRYEDAMAALKRIAKGEMRLTIAPVAGEEPDDGGPNPLTTGGPARLFSRDKMRGL